MPRLLAAVFLFSFAPCAEAIRNEKLNPLCEDARKDPVYSHYLQVPVKVTDVADRYRAKWRVLCRGEGEDLPTLHDLIVEGQKLEKAFRPVLKNAQNRLKKLNQSEDKYWTMAEEIDREVSVTLPTFTPGFEGRFFEGTYFRPSIAKFALAAELGDTQDQTFFRKFARLRGEAALMPWILMTWDSGGCTRYGDYDWIRTLKLLSYLEGKFDRGLYVQKLKQTKATLLRELTQSGRDRFADICTCGKTESVLTDLEEIAFYLSSIPEYQAHLPRLKKIMSGIESGRIQVASEEQTPCSGR